MRSISTSIFAMLVWFSLPALGSGIISTPKKGDQARLSLMDYPLSYEAAQSDETNELASHALLKLLNLHQAVEADFAQTVFDEDGTLVKQSTGEMKLARPRRFYWLINQPDNQLVIADGTWIWVYDKDLEQVVKRRQNSQNNLPVQLLSGSLTDLTQNYWIKNQVGKNADHHFKLLPKDDESVFSEILIGFEHDLLSEMQLIDQLGQRTVFHFNRVKVNQPVDKAWYQFNPPKGVDVIVE